MYISLYHHLLLKDKLKKYSQLLRLDQPIGYLLLMMPCFWGVLAASNSYQEVSENLYYFLIFAVGSIIMRSAGCVINDLFDKDLDKYVLRTAQRPLASGTISSTEAIIIFILLNLCGLAILLTLNLLAIIIGLISFMLFIVYPLMKRITYWPQFFLGITFNVGCLIGYASVENILNIQIAFLYLAGIFWTLGYDTIYAHQDRSDDLDIGIKSTAILFGEKTKYWVAVFYSLMLLSLFSFGVFNQTNFLFFIGLFFVAMHLYYQIKKLDINNSKGCLKIFKSNQQVGILVVLAILISIL